METTRLIVLVAMASLAAACSKHEAGAASSPGGGSSATASTAAAPPSPAPPPAPRTACTMVTAAEMSTIIGTAVAAQSDDRGSSTTCTYQPAGRSTPFVEVKVTWGDGKVALSSTRMLNRLEPGIADKLAGLGDEAATIGPGLWVRTGEDLVMLTFMGVDDHIAAAKRLIGLMRPRMGPSAQAR